MIQSLCESQCLNVRLFTSRLEQALASDDGNDDRNMAEAMQVQLYMMMMVIRPAVSAC